MICTPSLPGFALFDTLLASANATRSNGPERGEHQAFWNAGAELRLPEGEPSGFFSCPQNFWTSPIDLDKP